MGVTVESDLSTLYQLYSNLKYFGHFGIDEIDNMLPFERDIYFGLLQKTLEEQNKHK